MTNRVPVADGLFTWPSDEPALLASRCTACGNHAFPRQDGCPRCSCADVETVELGRRGRLWTWTVQAFPPKAPPFAGDADPERFRPFGVGYVDLDGKLLVESRLTINDPDDLEIDMELELCIEPLFIDDAGNEVVTFAFGPVAPTGVSVS